MDVMIGIDPHKGSDTAVALDGEGELLDQLRITADRRQLALLLAFAEKWSRRRFAIEDRGEHRGVPELLPGGEVRQVDSTFGTSSSSSASRMA